MRHMATFFISLFAPFIISFNPVSADFLYEYDSQNRLINAHLNATGHISYTFDMVGNRLSLTSSGMNLAAPVITDAGTYSLTNTQLNIHVGLLGASLGNITYEFAVGTSAGGNDIVGWSPFVVQADGNLQLSGFNLPWGQRYFVSVRVRNFTGDLITPNGTTDGITVLNPTADNDSDGATNQLELSAGTDPLNPDSDGDGMRDGWELTHQLNPLENDAFLDKDGDKFSNLREYVSQSDPNDKFDVPACIADFDNDGDIDGTDLSNLKREYNRQNCSEVNPCQSDIYADGKVDKTDLIFFTEDFGRDDCEFF